MRSTPSTRPASPPATATTARPARGPSTGPTTTAASCWTPTATAPKPSTMTTCRARRTSTICGSGWPTSTRPWRSTTRSPRTPACGAATAAASRAGSSSSTPSATRSRSWRATSRPRTFTWPSRRTTTPRSTPSTRPPPAPATATTARPASGPSTTPATTPRSCSTPTATTSRSSTTTGRSAFDGQRELPRRRRDDRRRPLRHDALEPRDAHAHEPHRPVRRVGIEQLERDRGHALAVVRELLDRAVARDVRPVGGAQLDPDRPPARLLALQPGADLGGERAHRLAQDVEVGDVGVERRLARARLRRARRLDRRGVVEERQCVQPAPHAAAEALDEPLRGRGLQVPDHRDAHPLETLLGARADPLEDPRRPRREPRAGVLAREDDEPGRLLGVARGLGDEAVRPDADRDRDPGALADLGDELAQDAQRLVERADVGVRLVDRHLLERRLQPLGDEPPHLGRLLAVRGEVGRDDDGVRAQPPRARGRHRRSDPELARLVRSRRDDRARPRAGDDHRLAGELGVAQELDGRIERVAVHVDDDAPRWRRLGHDTRAYAALLTALPRHEDRADAREAEAVLRRGGEVELAAAGVRAAVDDRHTDGAPVVAQRHLRPARQRLVGDTDRAGCQRAAAPQVTTVQAGSVPRHLRVAVDVEAPDALAGRPGADAHGGAAGRLRAEAEREAAAGGGPVAVDRVPPPAGAALQSDVPAGGGADDAARDERAAAGDDVQAPAGDGDIARGGFGRRTGGVGGRRMSGGRDGDDGADDGKRGGRRARAQKLLRHGTSWGERGAARGRGRSGGQAQRRHGRPRPRYSCDAGHTATGGTPTVGVPAIVSASIAADVMTRGASGSAARFSWETASRRST